MQEITAYIAADGSLFTDEDKAEAHDNDLLGMELDGLLRLFKLEISRHQEYKGLLACMKERKELLKACHAIVHILEHSEGQRD